MNQTKGFIALIASAGILGTFGVLIRELAKSFSDPGSVFVRSFSATVIITLIILFKKVNPFQINKQNFKYVLAFCVVFPLSLLSFTASANLIKVTNSLFMLYVGSLASTLIFGKIIFKEVFSAKHILALILVLIGLGFFIYPFSIESLSQGLILGLVGGVLEGTSHTLRKLMKNLKREVVVFYQSLSGVILAASLLYLSNEIFMKEFHVSSLAVAIVFGFLLVAIGYFLAYGFGNFDVNWGTIILATELFFAMVVSAVFLKEYPTLYEFIGGLLIFSGTVVTTLQLGKNPLRKKPEAVDLEEIG